MLMKNNFFSLSTSLITLTFFFFNLIQFHDSFSMEAKDLDDDSPLKQQFLNTHKNKKESTTGPLLFFPNLPIELHEEIIEKLIDDKDKATILPLSYAAAYLNLSNKTQRELKNKISLYHAVHIITKMPSCKTPKERIALRKLASNANKGVTYWNDIPEYSLWETGMGLKRDIKKQFRKYLENSEEHAENLNERLQAHFNRALDDEEYNEKCATIIQGYYTTRTLFLDDSHQLEGKLRDKANKIFKSCLCLRYGVPFNCCYMGVGGCVTISLAQPTGIAAWMMLGGSFFCLFSGLYTTILLCNDGTDHRSFFDHPENTDHWERLTGIPNTQKYITLTKKEILKLKNKKDFELL